MSDFHENAVFIAPEPADLSPFFPGYDIQGLIATGGMGAVYCALQKSLDRKVALKILPTEFSKDAAFCAGFEAEAKAMARLNHPNLIGVYDFGEVNGMLYIMMEFVPGKSLYHSAHGTAIDPSEVIRLVTGVCKGLAHAHENGIIHRDIKPSNILLDLQAQPKIGDFGLASPIDRKVQEGEIIYGTPHYTAPEVVDSPHSVDYRADIFSVGVLLHELLTGKLPADDPRPASTIVRCDTRFDTIIRRATQPIPAARYSSASQIASDLQVIASSLVPKAPRTAAIALSPVSKAPRTAAIPPSRRVPPKRAVPSKAKKSSPVPLLIMMLAVAASIAAIAYFSKKPPAPIIVPAPVWEDSATGHPKRPKMSDTVTEPTFIPPPRNVPKREPRPESPTVSDTPPESGTQENPASSVSTEPKYDVADFFERARKIMKDRAKPLIATHDESLAKNIQDCGIDMLQQVRRLETGPTRVKVQNSLDLYIRDCKEQGNRITHKSSRSDYSERQIEDMEKFETLRDEFLRREEAIDDLLFQSLSQLSGTYILGLEKQIQRLSPKNDADAIEQIQAEIDQTRSDKAYFPSLMTDAHIPKKDSHDEEELHLKSD